MIHLRRLPWSLAALLALALPVRAQTTLEPVDEATRQRSHVLDRFDPPIGNPEDLLKRHSQDKQNQDLADLLRKYGIKPETLEQMRRDPNFKQMLENFNPNNPLLPPDVKEKLKGVDSDALRNRLKETNWGDVTERMKSQVGDSATGQARPENRNPPKGESEPPTRPTNPEETPARPPMQGSPAGMGMNGGATPPFSGVPETSALSKRVQQFAENLQRLDPSFRDSPALRRAIRELGEHVGAVDPRWDKLEKAASELGTRINSWRRSLPIDQVVRDRDWSWASRLNRSWMPKLRLPEGAGGVLRNSPSYLTGPMGNSSGQRWQGLIAIIGLAFLLAVLLAAFLRGRNATLDRSTSGWQLGPWPVDPKAIGTRDDLIKAFEYLSLLRLGPEARMWNHRTLAECLAGEPEATKPTAQLATTTVDPAVARTAARELADFYEQARYAPAADALSSVDWDRARRDLCQLAGVTAV